MLHIQNELQAAYNYAKNGWTTADEESPKRQNYKARNSAYEAKLKDVLRICTKPMTVFEIADKAAIPEGTAKKYVNVLFKRRLLDRNKREGIFYYSLIGDD